jgi:glycosyltransferase involved in cell wall biosynthesis
MNVLWLNWRDINHPQAGGAETYIQEVAKRIVSAGNSVTLFASSFDKSIPVEIVDGVQIVRGGGAYSVYLSAERYYQEHNGKEKFSVLLDSINTVPFFVPLYVQGPYVALVFQLTGEAFSRIFPCPVAVASKYLEPIVYRLVYRESRVIVLSKSIAMELERIGLKHENIHIAEPGVDGQYYRPGKQAESPSVLYLNRVVPYKNVDHILRAFVKVKKQVPKAQLVIAGCRGTRYESELRKLAIDLGVADATRFLGFVRGDSKRILLQNAWVHVLPSTKEGWGISVVEAAACGVPTVAYNVPGLRDSVRNSETGVLVQFGDVVSLADSITKVLLDDEFRVSLSRNARKRPESLSWERTAREWLSVLTSI